MAPKRRRRRGREARANVGVYPEDHVAHVKKKKTGWVTAVGGYSYEPSVEEGADTVPVGFAAVRWMGSADTVQEPLEKLAAVERPAARGDRVSRHDGVLGTVVSVERLASVVIPPKTPPRVPMLSSPQEIDVSLAYLRPAGHWRVDDLVVSRALQSVGRVVDALFDVTIRRADGLCVVHESQDVRSAFEGWGAADYVSTDELCPHFPGQTVACDYGKWCAAEWLEGNAPKRPRNRRTWPKGTVEKVVATSVAVRWCTKGSNPAVLEEWVAPEEMEVLPWMWLDGWRLGDHVVPSNEAIRQLSAMPGWSDKVEISADLCGVVSRITSKLTVRWADGTVTQVPSLDVRPWRNTGGHEFLPHQLVALSENLQPDDSQPHRCRGVVRSANLEERTCDVYWLPCLNNQTTEPFLETNVSVYELTEHPDFDFLPGDTVLKLGGGASWLGVVEDVLADGTLQVDWDGTTEVAKMEDLLRVDDGAEEDDGYVDEEDEEDLDAGLSEGEEAQATGSGDEATTEASTERGDDEDLSADAEPQAAEPERVESVSAGPVSGIAPDEDDEVLGGLTAAPADHAFVAEPVEAVRIAVVRREMKAFQRGLPEDRSIFVRSFDDTPQLFRVCVIGPEKTPYADVPFVFDCWLPANYPNVPPKVLGKAVWGPERLNPNLYSDGKVCLSLLGTWDGPGWDKQNSTLLQVFLSIQALVLVENPYYNEPGYEQHKSSLDGERNSALYNENARLLSLHAACALAENPPRGLAKVLDTHFRSAGRRIVKTCEDIAQRPAEFGHSAGYSRCIARLLPRLRTSLIKDDASETEGLVSTQAPSGSSDSSVP